MAEQASRTDPGVLRRRLARLAQLGIVRTFAPAVDSSRDRPDAYVVTTTGGDTALVPRAVLPWYLDGLAHGAHAASGMTTYTEPTEHVSLTKRDGSLYGTCAVCAASWTEPDTEVGRDRIAEWRAQHVHAVTT